MKRPKTLTQIGVLYNDENAGEGEVIFSPEYEKENPVHQVDMITDWVSQLEAERDSIIENGYGLYADDS